LLLCDEIVSWIRALTQHTEVSSRTLAVDVVESIGPEGQFLDTDHTLDCYRERWYPSLFDRSSYESWVQKGERDVNERAAEKVDRLVDKHKPATLPDSIKKDLQCIVDRAGNRAS